MLEKKIGLSGFFDLIEERLRKLRYIQELEYKKNQTSIQLNLTLVDNKVVIYRFLIFNSHLFAAVHHKSSVELRGLTLTIFRSRYRPGVQIIKSFPVPFSPDFNFMYS